MHFNLRLLAILSVVGTTLAATSTVQGSGNTSKALKQQTREQILHRSRVIAERKKRGPLAPRASGGIYPSCPAAYDLGIDNVAYFVNYDFFSGNIAAKVVNTLQDCYDYCTSTNGCGSFVWTSGSHSCYLKGGETFLVAGQGTWALNDGASVGQNSGLYVIDATCGDMSAQVPTAVDQACCSTTRYTPPTDATCPAVYNLATAGLTNYRGWNYLGSDVGSTFLSSVETCYQYCAADANCFAFLWNPTNLACYKKGNPTTWNPNSWLYNTAGLDAPGGGLYIMDTSKTCTNFGAPAEVISTCCQTVAYVGSSPTCPSPLYNLEVASPGLAYVQNYNYNANGLASKNTNNLELCYEYCAATANCAAFIWSPSNLGCYLRSSATASPGSWITGDAFSAGVSGGTYIMDGTCQSNNLPATVNAACCQTQPYVTADYPTCPAVTDALQQTNVAYYPAWDYFGYDVANLGAVTSVQQCYNYCASLANCEAFVYNELGNACYTKGAYSGLTRGTTWLFNDGFVQGVGGGTYIMRSCEQADAGGLIPAGPQAACCNTPGLA